MTFNLSPEQWEFLKGLAAFAGAATTVSLAAIKVGAVIFRHLRSWAQKRSLNQRLGGEHYTLDHFKEAISFYVQPDCLSVDPSGGEDFRRIISAREPLFQCMDRVLENPGEYRFVIVLADSGMGKTSFVLNYYAHHWQSSRRRKRFNLRLVPLDISDADSLIANIPVTERQNTVIMLDGLDEDQRAIANSKARILDLLQLTQQFRTVVFTCRSQFFTKEEEIPKETGIGRLLHQPGKPGEFYFHKLYLAPLTDEQVGQYLKCRYPWYRYSDRDAARRLIRKVPDLVARPMLLANIDRLIRSKAKTDYLFQIYEEMVTAWLLEEKHVPDKKELRDFSDLLAENLFVNRSNRKMARIPYDELEPLAAQHGIKLYGWQLRGRSLLNRDAEGNYKFAHPSIMEYLFIRRYLKGLTQPQREPWTDMMKLFYLENIRYASEHPVPTPSAEQPQFLPFTRGADLSGTDLSNLDLSGVDLSQANLAYTHLAGANLQGTRLANVDLSGADIRGANLVRADFTGANLLGTLFDASSFRNVAHCEPIIKGVDALHVVKDFVGEISYPENDLVIEEGIVVSGPVVSKSLVVKGFATVRGDIFSRSEVRLLRDSCVRGNITTGIINIWEGADFRGTIEIKRAWQPGVPTSGPPSS